QRWREWHPEDYTLREYLQDMGTWEVLAACATLFWPEFVEVDGGVFRAQVYSAENVSHWMEVLQGDRRAVEAMINHLHVGYLLSATPEHEEICSYLLQVLAGTWAAALRHHFPDREFEVLIDDDQDPEITFCQRVGAPTEQD